MMIEYDTVGRFINECFVERMSGHHETGSSQIHATQCGTRNNNTDGVSVGILSSNKVDVSLTFVEWRKDELCGNGLNGGVRLVCTRNVEWPRTCEKMLPGC